MFGCIPASENQTCFDVIADFEGGLNSSLSKLVGFVCHC